MIQVSYHGKAYSLNQAFQLHWTKKKERKEQIIRDLTITHTGPKIITYTVTVSYHSRLDVDNCTAITKLVVDHLRTDKGLLIDDSPKYFRSLSITFDPELKKNTYNITISPVKK